MRWGQVDQAEFCKVMVSHNCKPHVAKRIAAAAGEYTTLVVHHDAEREALLCSDLAKIGVTIELAHMGQDLA
jgi:hypothetical protein